MIPEDGHGAKKLKSKKVKKAIYKTAKKIGQAGVEGAVDAATDRAREEGGRIVRDAGKKKEKVDEGLDLSNILEDVFKFDELPEDTVRLSASTIEQLFKDTNYSLSEDTSNPIAFGTI